MKNIILVFLFISNLTFAQSFTVEKLSGEVKVLRGNSENWEELKIGGNVDGSDLISTDKKSSIVLNNNGERFLLNDNSALLLSYVKSISLNELLLALAMDELRNVPKGTEDSNAKNTAVYGDDKSIKSSKTVFNDLGIKKINGAKQLAGSDYKESAIIVAKETYRKHPDTKLNIADVLFFNNLLIELKLYEDAFDELDNIKLENISKELINEIAKRKKELKSKLL